MSARVTALSIGLAVFVACGGSAPAPAPPGSSAPADPQSADDRLAMAGAAECERMCPTLTGCAVAKGRAADDLSAEDRAALDDRQTLQRNTQECLDGCKSASLSPRQVRALAACNDAMPAGEPTVDSCGSFLACLDAVQPRQ
jgi:hypothetical protein